MAKLKELLARRGENQDTDADVKDEPKPERPHLDITL